MVRLTGVPDDFRLADSITHFQQAFRITQQLCVWGLIGEFGSLFTTVIWHGFETLNTLLKLVSHTFCSLLQLHLVFPTLLLYAQLRTAQNRVCCRRFGDSALLSVKCLRCTKGTKE